VAAKCDATGSASSRAASRSALSRSTKSAWSLMVASLARMSSASALVVSCSSRLHRLIASLTASRRPIRSSWNAYHNQQTFYSSSVGQPASGKRKDDQAIGYRASAFNAFFSLRAKFHPIGATCRPCGAKNFKIASLRVFCRLNDAKLMIIHFQTSACMCETWFLANVNSRSRSLYAVDRPSDCRLSVCLSVCRL